MFEHMMSGQQLALREEVRQLVRWVPRQMILDMDADKIRFPRQFLAEAGRRNLLGCRYPRRWGGRDLDWATTCMVMEEVGTLGYIFACVFGVGAELVCDAIILHGSDLQKEKVMGGIGYTSVYPVERIVRDLRLASIWTGTNEVMSLITASEWYREQLGREAPGRDHEADAEEAGAPGEKVFE